MTNRDIAGVFNEIAELLDIEGANPFRIRAYRNAARMIASHPKEMESLIEQGYDLTQLRTIGKDLAQKITEMVKSGQLGFLEDLKRRISPELEKLLKIPGLGPKRVRILHEMLGITTLSQLKTVLEAGQLDTVMGFGPKLLATLRKNLGSPPKRLRIRLDTIRSIAEEIVQNLCDVPGVIRLEIAGSIRRRREDVKDIDLVAATRDPQTLMERFTSFGAVRSVVMKGPSRSSIILDHGIHVDLRAVTEDQFTTALHHFTGSKAHNVALRTIAVKSGMKINEYGIFRGSERLNVPDEATFYRTLGLDYIVPELRENRGEIEAALAGRLPRLIERHDIRGDLHLHTSYTDGSETIESMARSAQAIGYEYIAITDHTRHLKIAHGLDENALLRQIDEIDRLNETLSGITILKSAEVDILADGTLDLDDTTLARLDLAVCAVHYRFNLSRKDQTRRILKAMDNPHCTILAHPTGRLLELREGYDIDMKAILRRASEEGIILELNAQPDRLDLNDIDCRMAKEAGVKISIATDAHSLWDLDRIENGIYQARRGWLEATDVVNTLPLSQLKQLLDKRRSFAT